MKRILFAVFAFALGVSASHAFVKHGTVGAAPPPPDVAPTIASQLPEIVGLDTVGSTLSVRPGVYDGTASTKTYSWYMLATPGTVLGTSATFGPLTSAQVTACSGSTDTACGRLQVTETACNSAGCAAPVLSDFFGPVETALPSPAPCAPGGPTCPGTAPTAWPTYPGHYLQNGHAIYPGCTVPPAAPTSTPANVWYFDPAGRSLNAGATGHAGDPFNDPIALFNGTPGYGGTGVVTSVSGLTGTAAFLNGTGFTSTVGQVVVWVDVGGGVFKKQTITSGPTSTGIGITLNPPGITPTPANTVITYELFPRIIKPGDAIYIKPNPSGASFGSWDAGGTYSTSDGTTTGTLNGFWTWIMGDPSVAAEPVFDGINIKGGGAGFLFKNLNVEGDIHFVSPFNNESQAINVTGGTSTPAHDLIFESVNEEGWKGHSNDPFSITYPTTGGSSDGTVQTASPTLGQGEINVSPQEFSVTASANATKLFLVDALPANQFSPVGMYAWSPGYFFQFTKVSGNDGPPTNTGIPNGTIVKDLQGNPALNAKGTVATSASLPATAVVNDAWLALNTKHLWIGVSGPSWSDAGLAYLTIGKCDALVDASTGCPPNSPPFTSPNGTQFVGCDPLVPGVSGGCAGGGAPGWGAAPTWNGTTRAITATEDVQFTDDMKVVPAGYWNHVNWDFAPGGFHFRGGMAASPNDVQGVTCLSVKDSTVRHGASMYTISLGTNSIFYHNKSAYRIGDGTDHYSAHRILHIGNFDAEPTLAAIYHMDSIQLASDTLPAGANMYGSAIVDNEFFGRVDPNNQFPSYTQGIDNTDLNYNGVYVANNMTMVSGMSLGINGLWNVMSQNTALGDQTAGGQIEVRMLSGTPAALPQNDLAANNVTLAIIRDRNVSGANTNCSADANTVTNNINPSSIDWGTGTLGSVASIHCNATNTGVIFDASQGIFPDVNRWTQFDWRSGNGNPLFTSFSPIAGGHIGIDSCLRNEFRYGTCNAGDPGALNFRPNPSFVSTPTNVIAQINNACTLPTTGVGGGAGAIGDKFLAQASTGGNNGIAQCAPQNALIAVTVGCGYTGVTQIWPAGVYTRKLAGGVQGSTAWTWCPFTPGIIGAGVSLGPQKPPARHDRTAQPSTPNIGAY